MQAIRNLLVLFLFLATCLTVFGQQIYRPYPGARLQEIAISPPFEIPPAFNCSFEPDFENNFDIREAAATEYTTLDIVMPLVGDVTGNGIPDIIIPAKPVNIGADNDGYGRPYFTSRTKDLLVYNMDQNEQLILIGKITTPYISLESPTQYVLAKIPGVGNGNPLIIVAASWDPDNIHGGFDYSSRLVAYQWNGGGFNQVWVSNEKYGRNVPWSEKTVQGDYRKFRSGGAPAVADFNSDGTPEVYIYNEIFNAQNGDFIVDGGDYRIPGDTTSIPMGQGISQISPGNTDEMLAGAIAVSVAANLDNDPGKILELAAGNTVYRVNIGAKTMTPIFAPALINGQFPRDGFTSIADIDGDGQLDIIVTTARNKLVPNSRQMYVWTLPGTGSPLVGGALLPISDNSGAPNDVAISLAFIGDVNGDRTPNIGFTTGNRLWMFNYVRGGANIFTPTWGGLGYIGTNDQSGYTLITMFDFDQDGRQELVYRDERNIRIIDGQTGTNRFDFPSFSITAGEGAIVADVNLDGEADILVTDRGKIWDQGTVDEQLDRSSRLVVYKSKFKVGGKKWAPARSVWNQYPYFSFNVHDDLAIPKPQENHGSAAGIFFPKLNSVDGCLVIEDQPFNSFLVQTTVYNDLGCLTTGINLMDAKIEIHDTSRFLCYDSNTEIELFLTISNQSDAIGDPAAVMPDDTPIAFYLDDVYVGSITVADLGLTNIMPGQSFDVSYLFSVDPAYGVSDQLTNGQVITAVINFDPIADESVYDECNFENESAPLSLISRPLYDLNSPASQCFEDQNGAVSSFTLTPVNTVPGSVDSDQLKWFLNDLNGSPLTTGGNYFIDTDFSLTVSGLTAGTYTFILVDECTGETVERTLVVDPLPSPAFASSPADCFDTQSGKITVENALPSYVYYVSGELHDTTPFGETRFASETELENATFKAGSYSIRTVNEDGTNCQLILPLIIDQPIGMDLNIVEEKDPECEPNNGTFTWTITGGNPEASFPFYDYSLVNTTLNQTFNDPTIVDLGGGQKRIENLEGGIYELTATDAKGCPITAVFELIPQQDPQFDLPEDVTICFQEEAVVNVAITFAGQPEVTPIYQWGKMQGGNFTEFTNGAAIDGGQAEISADGTTLTLRNLPANENGYDYVLRIANACDQPDTPFKVIVNPLPEAVFEPLDVSCFEGTDGEIKLSQAPTGSTSGFTYVLNGEGLNQSNDNGNFSGLPSGTYSIQITNNQTSCLKIFEDIIINEPSALLAGANGSVPVTCEQVNNGSVFFEFSGGTAPYTFVNLTRNGTVMAGITHPDTDSRFEFTGLEIGDYSLSAVDANGCPLPSVTVTITEIPVPVVTLDVIGQCFVAPITIEAELTVPGGLTNPTYTWIAPDGQQLTGASGNLNLGGTYELIAGAGMNPPDLLLNGIAAAENPYEFKLELRGDLSCDTDFTVDVIVNPAPVPDFTTEEIVCYDSQTGKIKVSNEQTSYVYYISGTIFDGSDFPETRFADKAALESAFFKAGQYTIKTVNENGTDCQTINTVEILGPAGPIVLEDDYVIIGTSCNEDNGIIQNVNITGGWGNYTVEWRKDNAETGTLVGSSLPAVSDLASGTYFLIVTDEKGCEAIFEFIVPEQPLPDVVIPDQTVCEGADVTLTPTQTVSGASQTDLIWYKDAAGTDPVPNGQDPSLTQVNYTIDGDKILLIKGLPAGVYTYYLKIVCTDEIKAVKVTVHADPNPVFGKTDLLCYGIPTGKITVTANGNPDFRYSINGQAPVTQSALEAMDLSAGSYDIIVSQIGTACTYSETVVLTEPEEFIFEALDKRDPTCGSDDGMIQFSVSGGVKDYVITINNKAFDTFNYSENNGVYTVEDLALGEYDIVVLDANDCRIEELAAFALVDDNIVSVQSKNLVDAICEGEEAVLNPELTIAGSVTPTKRWYKDAALTEEIVSNYDPAGTGVMYDIDPASGQLTVYNLPLGAVTYYLQVTDPLICTVVSKADVNVTPIPEPVFEKVDILCFGEQTGKISVVSGSDPKLRYSVNGGEFITQSALEALSFVVGTYIIDYKHIDTDCGGSQTIEILQPEQIVLDAVSQSNPSCGLDDGIITFTVSGGIPEYAVSINNKPLSDYDFIEDNGTYIVEGLALGEYDIVITDDNECQLTELAAFSLIDDNENTVQSKNLAIAICEGEEAVLTPELTITGSFTPTLKWFADEELTSEISDNYDPAGAGVMYAIDPVTGQLTVYNLPLGQVTYYLEVSDDLICTVSSKADVTVFDVPEPEFETVDILCFGEETGKIKLIGGADPKLRFSINGEPRITTAQLEALNFAAGTYILETFYENSDCGNEQTLEILQPEELILEKVSFTNPSCNEENGDIVFEVKGGVTDYIVLINGEAISTYSFSENNGRYVVNQLAPGIYDILTTDANGCAVDASFELVNFDAQPITAEPMKALVCEGNPLTFTPDFDSGPINPIKRWFTNTELTQEIISNYNPAGTGVMYNIDPVTGAMTVYNLPKGQYTYYLQLSDPEICTLVTPAAGTVNPGIEAEADPTDEICFGEADGTILISNISGGSGDYEFSLDNATWQSGALFENLAAGTYTAYIRDLGGDVPCELIIPDILVDGPTAAIDINDDVVIINASCDLPNGSISNVQLSGGWGNFAVEWRSDSPTGSVVPGDQNGAADLLPGKYFLLVTDEKGCEAVFEFEITELDKPVYEPVAPVDICALENNTLTVINTISGASSTAFTWSKGANQTNPVGAGPDPVLSGVSYEIREELNTIHLDIKGLPAGDYTYYFFAACTGQEIPISFEVYAIPDPELEKTDITCFDTNDGKIRVIDGGDPEITYSVNGGAFVTQAELEAMDLAAGDYTIIAKNQLDCTSPPQTITIINPDLLEIELSDSKNAACGSNDGFIAAVIKGGNPEYTLNLLKVGVKTATVTTSGTTHTFTNLSPGEYQIETIDENGCLAELTAPVLIEEGPTEIIIEDNYQICEGEVLELKPSLNPVAANPVYTWYWMNYGTGNKISPNQEISGVVFGINAAGELSISGLGSGGPYTVWVEVAGAGICEGDLKEIKINVDPAPVFTAEVMDEDCFGAGGEIRLIPSANQSNIKYSLNGGDFQIYSSNVITGLAPGSYTISAQNELGCIYELPEALEIVGPAAPLALNDFEVTNATCGVNDGILRGKISGGTPEYTITLLDENDNMIGSAISSQDGVINITNLAPGNYKVRIMDANGCILMEEGISLTNIPTEIRANDQVICEGEIAIIQASIVPSIASPVYQWYYDVNLTTPVQVSNTADQFGATYQISPAGTMRINGLPGRANPYSYFIMVEGDGICPPEVKEVKVTVQPKPTLRVSNPSIVCDPTQTVNLTQFIEGFNPNVFDYIVTNPNGKVMRLEDLARVAGTGSYTVQSSYKGLNCWTPVDRIAVIISDKELIANFQYEIQIDGVTYPDMDVQMEELINFKDMSLGNVIVWNWDFGDGNFSSDQNPVHQYMDPGTYVVRLTTIDSFGCTAVIEKVIQVFDDYLIIIPNAFTPDGANNKYFKPKFRGITTMELYIFNTWGDLIYETDNLEDLGWDGTLKGQKTPNGNYVYRAIFTTRSGIRVDRAGVFTLIR